MNNRKEVLGRTLGYVLGLLVLIVAAFTIQIRSGGGETPSAGTQGPGSGEQTEMANAVQPLASLGEHCTRCHSERRYLKFHGSQEDFQAIVKHMESNADFKLTPQELEKVHASLSLMKCTRCHDESALNAFCTMDAKSQTGVLNRMSAVPNAKIARADYEGIQRSVSTVRGF